MEQAAADDWSCPATSYTFMGRQAAIQYVIIAKPCYKEKQLAATVPMKAKISKHLTRTQLLLKLNV